MQIRIKTVMGGAIALGVFGSLMLSGRADVGSECAVQLSVQVQEDPPQITLLWSGLDGVIGYSIARKSKEDTSWGPAVVLPADAVRYDDTNVVVGATYEYHVFRAATNCNSHSYILSAIKAPLVESRGKVILVVDNTLGPSLAAELAVLQQDLVGDGWTVLRHDVPRMSISPADLDPSHWTTRSNEVARLRNVIRADYLSDRANVKAVFLLGHVPVPYSGSLGPDEHPDHHGAWPADVFYGDMDGTWTDSAVSNSSADDPRNRNVPGDGKFDQTFIPGPVALQVGRVDTANLTILPYSELESLSRYLAKDHQFRQRLIQAHARALVDDNFGALNNEIPAANGWANVAPLVGAGNVSTGRWLTDAVRDDYLWAYGCGAGTYTSASGVVSTSHFLVYDIRVVFAMLFGSYFGDWDSENNLLRAPLAAAPYTLASVWTGRPNWYFHHMALGETIGYSTRLSQSNTGLYQPNGTMNGFFLGGADARDFMNGVHVALMGDPTLRMQPVSPPGSLAATGNDSGGVDLSWAPSADEVLGYHVYRAASPDGPYARLTASLVVANSYAEPAISSQRYYMVRAVKLENSPSGTYSNPSQGAFAELILPPSEIQTNTWAGQGVDIWSINDVSGTPGANPGWDWQALDGALNITATPANQFTVQLKSFTSDNIPGPPAHFDYDQTYSWPILTASAGITGLDTNAIRLVTTEFDADLAGGLLSLALSADTNSINVVFRPNRAPIAQPAFFDREWDKPLRIPIVDLLSSFTRDPDGDAVALLQVGSSTNGTSISSDGTALVFSFVNNLPETVTYWIQDIRPYGVGDTVRTANNTLTIQPLPKGLHFDAYHAIELEWQGELGQRYRVQSRLETETEWKDQGDPLIGTGQKSSIFERTTGVTKFYRIILLE